MRQDADEKLLAGTSRSRIDQRPKGPFNGFEDRACHRAKLAPTRILSALFVEDEKKCGQAQAGEGVDQRRHQGHRRNETSDHVRDGRDQIVETQDRYQNHSNQGEKCGTFEAHDRLL